MWPLSISSHPAISTWGARHETIQKVNSAYIQHSKVGSTSGHTWEQSRRCPSKISPENADTVPQAAMLPKQSYQYLLSCTSTTKVLLWTPTTTFCHGDFHPPVSRIFHNLQMYTSSQKCKGHNWCHTTVCPENKVVDGGTSFRKPWTSCIQAALVRSSTSGKHSVSAKRQRRTAVEITQHC